MPRLRLYLLGPPRIECDGAPIQVDTRKAVALLAYLALTRERHRRDSIVNLLWPELDHTRGRAALRRTLSALRRAIPRGYVDADRETVGLDPDAEVWTDVEAFRRHLAEPLAHGHPGSEVCPACLSPLQAAVALYGGDFLAGFTLRDSLNFDDWQFFQAERLRRELSDALEKLIRCHSAAGDLDAALGVAQRWLAQDRLEERAHRALMQLYGWTGQRSAALRQYAECVKILREELGVSPQPATLELYQEIQQGQGSRVPDPILAPSAASTGRAGPREAIHPIAQEERRLITVLSINASAALIGGGALEPEEEAELVRRFGGLVRRHVTEHGGQVERTLGGSVLGVFGARRTLESDPELAIRAAIAIREEALASGMEVRAGVNTGEIYWQGTDPGDRELWGTVVDLAMHLSGHAPAGHLLVAGSTYHLTRRTFVFTPLQVRIPGQQEAISAYQVEHLLPQPRKARGWEEGRTDLLGRDEEMAKLKAALDSTRRGRGQMVSLIGEAGVGKSRLVAELKAIALEGEGPGPIPLWLEGRCLELDVAPGYGPVIDMLRVHCGCAPSQDDAHCHAQVERVLEEMVDGEVLAEARYEEIRPLLLRLLSLDPGGQPVEAPVGVDPDPLHHRTLLAIRDYFLALSKKQPLVLAFEDLHWADDPSLDLISLLMEALYEAPVLLLCIYRPEREHRCWHLAMIAAQKCRERYTELRLRELTYEESCRLAASLLRSEDLPPAARQLILGRAQGNPFFIEEMVRSLIDAGTLYEEDGAWQAHAAAEKEVIPEGVRPVILSRVDRLAAGPRSVLQTAAVIGPLFRRHVLAGAIDGQVELDAMLWELEERALIYQQSAVPEQLYSFKHVLTQEAVYANIPAGRRAALHRRVAQAIETLHRERLEPYYEQLAHHYDRGGKVEKAVTYLEQAGEKAQANYAYGVAAAQLTRGLELLTRLPETPERDRRELALQVALGVPLVLTKGHGAPEVEGAYTRARALSEQLGETRSLFQVLLGLRRLYYGRGYLRQAHAFSERLLALAQELADPDLLARAYAMLAESSYRLGAFIQAHEQAMQGLALYNPERYRTHVAQFGNDTGVVCQFFASWPLWYLGYPDRAIKLGQQGLERARTLDHPFTLVFALYHIAFVHRWRGDVEAARECAQAVIERAAEGGFALFMAWAKLVRGWSLSAQGDTKGAIVEMEGAAAAIQATGAQLGMPDLYPLLAQAYARTGRAEEGLQILYELMEATEQSGQRYWSAELHRLKGELLLAQGGPGKDAEACYRQALTVAREQRAKSLELRAATSLSRLWLQEGKEGPARTLLEDIYGWFTEGFDTADLREAKALLDALM